MFSGLFFTFHIKNNITDSLSLQAYKLLLKVLRIYKTTTKKLCNREKVEEGNNSCV